MQQILVFFILFAIKKQYKDVQNNLDVVTRKTRDNLVGVRVIRAFTKESEEKESFNSTVSSLSFKQKKAGLISSLLNPLTYVIINIGIIFVIYIAGKEVESQNLLQGDVLALYNYMSQILVELIKFANLVYESIPKGPVAANFDIQSVYFDEQDEVWVVLFCEAIPEAGPVSTGLCYSIALQKKDGKVLGINYG